MSENREIYTAGKNFTLPPAVTALTNSTSDHRLRIFQGAPCTAIREVSLLKDLKHANIGELTELLKRQEYT